MDKRERQTEAQQRMIEKHGRHCSYCLKTIEGEYVDKPKSKQKNHLRVYYHPSCFKRKGGVFTRKQTAMKKPYRG